MRLEDQEVVGRQRGPQLHGVQRIRRALAPASPPEGRGVQDDAPAGERRMGAQHARPRRPHRLCVEECVRARGAQRKHPLDGRPERGRPRLPRGLAGAHDPVVVAMEERPLGFRERRGRVGAEALERARGVPHLHDRRARAVRGHVDREVGVVHDHQACGPHVVHAAHQPQEVPELAQPTVAVGLEQQDDLEVGPAGPDGVVEMPQVALESGRAGRGQDDPLRVLRQPGEQPAEDAEDGAREQVLAATHEAPGMAGGSAAVEGGAARMRPPARMMPRPATRARPGPPHPHPRRHRPRPAAGPGSRGAGRRGPAP